MIGEDGFNFVLVVNMRLESGIDIANEVVLLRNKNTSIKRTPYQGIVQVINLYE